MTNVLERDLKRLEANIKEWSALYNDEDMARAKRMIAYMQELRRFRNETKKVPQGELFSTSGGF